MNKQKLIQYLLEIGAHTEYLWLLDRLEFDSGILLESASANGHIDIVKYLVENGYRSDNYSALVRASKYGHIDIVKYLIKNGCNPNNSTALLWASANGYINIVKYLIEMGCNPNNFWALERALGNGYQEIVEYLESKRKPLIMKDYK